MSEETGFELTDDTGLQCCKQVGENSYKLVQYNEYPVLDNPFRVVEATINLNDYSTAEIKDYLRPYGYSDVATELDDYDGILAEIIFETDMLEFEESGQYATLGEAAQAIEDITGLDLREYYIDRKDLLTGSEYVFTLSEDRQEYVASQLGAKGVIGESLELSLDSRLSDLEDVLPTKQLLMDLQRIKEPTDKTFEKPRESTSLAQVAQESRDAAEGLRNDGAKDAPQKDMER